MEGHYETQAGAPLILFGLPDDAAEVTRYAVEIPRLGSLILTHEWNGQVRGLKAWPPDRRPKAALIFWTFRLMVALGLAMLGLALWAGWRRWQGRLYDDRALLRASLAMAPAGFVALIAGWITTEVGRQPWTVYGLLTTADSASAVEARAVAGSLTAFVLVYVTVFGAGIFYVLRLMRRPPSAEAPEHVAPTRAAGVMPGPARQDVLARPRP
jgi:cytochrome d ubiquinol oxidase subunit I